MLSIRSAARVLVPMLFAASPVLSAQTPLVRVPQDYATIQAAIDASNAGTIVLVTMNQDFTESPVVTKNLTITKVSGTGRLIGQFLISTPIGGPRVNRSTVVRGFTMFGNLESEGGGVEIRNADPIIRDCVIDECTTLSQGGGIFVTGGSNPLIERCWVTENTALFGGGIAVNDSECTIIDSVIADNIADNSFFDSDGAGIHVRSSDVSIRNCTIVGNESIDGVFSARGAGLFVEFGSSTVDLQNTIVFDNVTGGGAQQIFIRNSCTVDVGFSDVMGGQAQVGLESGAAVLNWGSGNFDQDPLFTLGAHISQFSPCVNAGDTSLVLAGEKDIDKQTRVFGVVVDVGADEFVLVP